MTVFDADAKARELICFEIDCCATGNEIHSDWCNRVSTAIAAVIRSAYEEGERAGQWQPMATAPQDRQIVVWAPDREGLHSMASLCEWHPDAGFCIDELRAPTHWLLPPEALRSQGQDK